ncbi:MAG: hypothetical protein M1587_00095 [Thaumarchaeota archaeon]|nr:hypothetical protein [Nitrososphaerota archaeon]
MNCPECRRALDYIPELSTPNAKNPKEKWLTYFCASCGALYRFSDFDTKMKVRGTLIMKAANLKRAGFLEARPLDHVSKSGEPKIV